MSIKHVCDYNLIYFRLQVFFILVIRSVALLLGGHMRLMHRAIYHFSFLKQSYDLMHKTIYLVVARLINVRWLLDN